jgi:acyl-CoA hydrolase
VPEHLCQQRVVTAYLQPVKTMLLGGTTMEWLVISAFSTVASMAVVTTVLTLMAL